MGAVSETRHCLAEREAMALLTLTELDDVADALVAGGEGHRSPGWPHAGGGQHLGADTHSGEVGANEHLSRSGMRHWPPAKFNAAELRHDERGSIDGD